MRLWVLALDLTCSARNFWPSLRRTRLSRVVLPLLGVPSFRSALGGGPLRCGWRHESRVGEDPEVRPERWVSVRAPGASVSGAERFQRGGWAALLPPNRSITRRPVQVDEEVAKNAWCSWGGRQLAVLVNPEDPHRTDAVGSSTRRVSWTTLAGRRPGGTTGPGWRVSYELRKDDNVWARLHGSRRPVDGLLVPSTHRADEDLVRRT